MIKFTTLNKLIKKDSDFIDNVMFGNYTGNECTCLVTFKCIGIEPCYWSSELISCINSYLENCNAKISASCSTANNIVIKFKVQLS